jgi:hypothetical protein
MNAERPRFVVRHLRGVGDPKSGNGKGFPIVLSLYGPVSIVGHTRVHIHVHTLEQRFPTFLTHGALFRINFYGGAP